MVTQQTTNAVELRLGDVSPLHLLAILRRVTGELQLRGEVIEVVELGNPPEAYAMMEVQGIRTPMLVPVRVLQH